MANIEILLATYNGAAYLPALLDSLTRQSMSNWRLTVRDDASTDTTREIIAEFAKKVTQPVRVVERGLTSSSGALSNFAALLDQADAEYIVFADQDDVWHPEKLATLLARMCAMEAHHPGKPVLVHSDLRVVDDSLNEVAESFWRYQGLEPASGARFDRLMLENCVTGCACMINRALLALSRPIPAGAIMHDWWLALVASAMGAVGMVEKTLVDYRQHASNSVGAKSGNVVGITKKLMTGGFDGVRRSLALKHAQMASFDARYGKQLQPRHLALVRDFLSLPTLPWGKRRMLALRNGMRMSTPVRSIGFYIAM